MSTRFYHPMRSASRLLTFLTICSALFLAGCNSGTDLPTTPGVFRNLGAFSPLAPWDDSGYKIDSASSMWIRNPQKGDLAVADTSGDPTLYPLATVFVKANCCVEGPEAKINLVAFDMDGTQSADLLADIASDEAAEWEYFCRHPAVEVTYSRSTNPLSKAGDLGIHVVWTQWTGLADDGHWALYYKYFHVPVTSLGIQWAQASDDNVVLISPGVSLLDDIQPDLAVDAENGNLLVIFTRTDEPENTEFNILAMLGRIEESTPATWFSTVYQVSSSSPVVEKAFPKMDVGLINTVPMLPSFTENRAIAAWSEWDPVLENFQIWYSTADPLNPGSIDTFQLTDSENGVSDTLIPYENWDILPSVDIPAPSSASTEKPNLQAVICWMGADFHYLGVQPAIAEARVYCRIGPFFDQQFLLKGDDDHCWMGDLNHARTPDVACYQMNNPDSEYQWIGVAMHASECDTVDGTYRLYTGSWSYQVNSSGFVTLNSEHHWNKQGQQYPFWSLNHPATGPSLCLRYYEPAWSIEDYWFGLGWIEGPGNNPNWIGLAQGTIYPY